MNRKIISLLLAASITASMTVAAFADDLSSGTPWIDSELEGAITSDMTFDLKDDFAAALNGEWVQQAEFAPGYSTTGTMTDIELLTDSQLKDLVTGENPDNDPYLAQVQDLYELYMDWDQRNEAGITPLMPVLNQLETIATVDDLTAFLTQDNADRGYLAGPMGFYVSSDLEDSSVNTLYISPSSLILEDSAEYKILTERGQLLKDNYLSLGRKILSKAGYSDERIEEIISNAMAFETAIAPSILTSDEQSAPDILQRVDNHITREELEAAQGDLPLLQCILASGAKEEDLNSIILMFPDWLTALSAMYTEENVPGMRDDMILNYALSYADSLDEETWQWYLDASNAIKGVKASLPVEQVAVNYVQSSLAWPLARAYAARYFTQEDKDRITQMCEDIVAEYKKMLQEEDFLSEETIAYACEKLDNLAIFSLYPDDDQWPDTSALSFSPKAGGGTFWDAVQAISEYTMQHSLAQLGEPNDRTKWKEALLPTEFNAANSITSNSITIYAAICQGGMYNDDMSTEEMYAAIGTVIGHEISHSFDSKGAQFDKNGNISGWWTEEDYAGFQEKVQKMMDYYSAISPWEGQQVHGSIITGEVCADIAGMKVMLRMAKSIPDFDYDLFFRTYANLWKAKCTREYELTCLTDVHPLRYLRINVTVAQQDEFIETYGIQEGDGMYIAPEDRVAIW